MLAVERKNRILSILQTEKKVVVGELSKMFSVSEETIRRDLEKLEKEGLIVKAYGGAVLNENAQNDMPLAVRKRTNVVGKQKIAEIVAGMIEDGASVMLDCSSTAYFIAKKLKERRNMTIITNSIEILIELKDQKTWKIFCTGGLLGEESLALVGNHADTMISSVHSDFSVISCKGFDIDRGITDSNDLHAFTKRTMIGHCDKRILAVDSSKFNRIAFNVVGKFTDVDAIVTDVKPPEDWLERFKEEGVRCLYPEEIR
ncbi:MAG: DeoR/GlpR transcriptional regulator [Clostridia bacterium]|nr:DeoR/GlpR transcriptional regulator [Clostridia bacterium]